MGKDPDGFRLKGRSDDSAGNTTREAAAAAAAAAAARRRQHDIQQGMGQQRGQHEDRRQQGSINPPLHRRTPSSSSHGRNQGLSSRQPNNHATTTKKATGMAEKQPASPPSAYADYDDYDDYSLVLLDPGHPGHWTSLVESDNSIIGTAPDDQQEKLCLSTDTLKSLHEQILGNEIVNLESTDLDARTVWEHLLMRPFCQKTQPVKVVAYALGESEAVRELDLRSNNIDDEGVRVISSHGLAKNKTLRILNLGRNKFGNAGTRALAKALTVNDQLQILHLDENNIGDNGAQHLADALKKNKSLTALHLGSNYIHDTGASALASMLVQNTSLQTLDLYRNKIGDKGAKNIAFALRTNHSLQKLVLDWNLIRADGETALADALRIGKVGDETALADALRIGKVSDDKKEGAKDTVDAPSVNTSLETLHLMCNESREGSHDSLWVVLADRKRKLCEWKKQKEKQEREQKLAMAEFDGSKILSQDELEIVVESVKEQQSQAEETASTCMTADSVTQLMTVTAVLDRLEPLYQDRILPSLEEIKNIASAVRGEMESEVGSVKAKFQEAQGRKDFEKMQGLAREMKGLRTKHEKTVGAATARLDNVSDSYKTRCRALGKNEYEPKESVQQCKEEADQGRQVIREALESKASGPAQEVPYEYLEVLTENWSENSQIAQGGQGYVYRGFDKELNCAVAVKQIPFVWDRGAFMKEFMSLSRLDHPNVVRLLAFAKSEVYKMSCLVYEYAAGGTMADILEDDEARTTFPWQRRVSAITQLVLALQYCHHSGVKHRDVKPQNICFADEDYMDLLLIDFGVATDKVGTQTSFAGSAIFMAPEWVRERKYFTEQTEAYSVGVVIVSLITGKTSSTALEGIVKDAARNPSSLAYERDQIWDSNVLGAVARIASQCLHRDPLKRPTMQEILDAMMPLRKQSTTELTKEQKKALDQSLSESLAAGTTQVALGKMCACGRKADDGVACLQNHVMCSLCLEGSVRRQIGADLIRCQVGSCQEHFDIAELRQVVSWDVLAEFAEHQQKLRTVDRLNNHMEEAMRRAIRREFRAISSGIAFVASSRRSCPSLCILWPSSTSWRPRFCKEYRLHFLCAVDRTPTKSFIVVKQCRKWVRQILPVLKYTLLTCQVASVLLGLPLPLPKFIPGSSGSEQIRSLVQSLSDIIDSEDFREWAQYVSELRISDSNDRLRKLLCSQADKIDADAHRMVEELARQPGNCGWEDEMVVANRGDEWAWVKKENKDRWEQSRA